MKRKKQNVKRKEMAENRQLMTGNWLWVTETAA